MRRKTISAIIMTWILCIALSMPILAAEADSAGNIFAFEDTISISDIPFFGAFTLGKEVVINNTRAKGSVAAGGQNVTITGSFIDESLYEAGELAVLQDTEVKGNIFMAGNNVMASGVSASNGAYLAGNEVIFEGNSNTLNIAARTAKVDANIDGDVYIKSEDIEIAPNTVITGKLVVSAANEPTIPETVQIGSYSFEKQEPKKEEKQETVSPIRKKVTSTIYWIAAKAALAFLLCWLFNKHLIQAAGYLKTNTGRFVGTAIGGLLLVPIAAIVLCLTFILLPLGILIMIAYGILLFVGTSFAGASLPRLFLPQLNVFLSTLIGVAVLVVLEALPFIGSIVTGLSGMYLLGYVIMYLWNNRMKHEPETVD